jgi:tetratricopeptide (TPR) repeat protein
LTSLERGGYFARFLKAPHFVHKGVTTLAKGRDVAEDLKHDPLLEKYVKVSGKVQENSRQIINILIGVAVVAAVVLIGWLIYSRRVNSAAEGMAEAFRVNDAIVANPIPPNVQGYAFTTQDEKHRKAFEAFTKAANDYPSYNGDLGRYYAATHQLAFEPEKAEVALKELAAKDSSVGVQAQMALAGRYESAGKYDDAIAIYKKLESKPGDLAPALIKLKLARSLEAGNKSKEAADIYFGLAGDNDVRSTGIGTEALSRLTIIDPDRVEKLPPPETKPGIGGLGGAPISVR